MEVNLRANNHTKFKQTIGSFATIIQVILITAYLGTQILNVVERNPSISSTSVYQDVINNPQPKYYNSSTLDMAILITSMSGNKSLNDDLFTYIDLTIINYYSYYEEVNGSLNLLMPHTYLDLEKCKEGRFDNYKAFTDGVKLVGNFWCLKDPHIMLQGNYASKTNNAVFVGISDCNQDFLNYLGKGQKCKNITAVQRAAIFADLQIVFYALTHYFDPQNYGENPIIPHVYTLYTYLDPNVGINYYFKVRENIAIGTNSYVSNSIGQFNHTFYDVYIQTSNIYKPNGDFQPYVSLGFFNDEEVRTQIRSNANLLQALSNVGGMMGVSSLMLRVILTRIYQAKFPIDIYNALLFKKKKKQGKISRQNTKNLNHNDSSSRIDLSNDDSKIKLNEQNSNNSQSQYQEDEQYLSYFEYLKLKWFMGCCNCCLKNHQKTRKIRSLQMYHKKMSDVLQNIDILTIAKMVTNIKSMKHELKVLQQEKGSVTSMPKLITKDSKVKKKKEKDSQKDFSHSQINSFLMDNNKTFSKLKYEDKNFVVDIRKKERHKKKDKSENKDHDRDKAKVKDDDFNQDKVLPYDEKITSQRLDT